MNTYHIWWYGLPYPDAVPFTNLLACQKELDPQLDMAASEGEYPACQIVRIKGAWPNVAFVETRTAHTLAAMQRKGA